MNSLTEKCKNFIWRRIDKHKKYYSSLMSSICLYNEILEKNTLLLTQVNFINQTYSQEKENSTRVTFLAIDLQLNI